MQVLNILIVIVLIAIPEKSYARQIKGRQTLPSDCSESETWVRGHAKTKGFWTAYCRSIKGSDSNSNSYKFWAPKILAGMPKYWPHQSEKTSDWKESEIEQILSALKTIPEQLWVSSLKGIYRSRKSTDYPNPASSGGGNIVLYDSAFSQDKNLSQILSHELAHCYYSQMPDREKFAYSIATGWAVKTENGREVTTMRRGASFLRSGCETSRNEDFACNVEGYLTKPEALKNLVPGAYNWIRQRFGDNFKLGR